MSAHHLNASLAATSSLGLALGVRLVVSPLVSIAPPPQAINTTTAAALPPPRLGSLGAGVAARDLFRVSRRPSPVVFDPVPPAAVPTILSARPPLILVGVVWDRGNDPTALIEGFPGLEGARPVRRSETIAGLRVAAISFERVVIAGQDTTWTLTVREPWR